MWSSALNIEINTDLCSLTEVQTSVWINWQWPTGSFQTIDRFSQHTAGLHTSYTVVIFYHIFGSQRQLHKYSCKESKILPYRTDLTAFWMFDVVRSSSPLTNVWFKKLFLCTRLDVNVRTLNAYETADKHFSQKCEIPWKRKEAEMRIADDRKKKRWQINLSWIKVKLHFLPPNSCKSFFAHLRLILSTAIYTLKTQSIELQVTAACRSYSWTAVWLTLKLLSAGFLLLLFLLLHFGINVHFTM